MKRPRFTRRLVVILIVAAVVVFLTGGLGGVAWFQPRFAVRGLSKINPDVLFEVKTKEKIVALTIDDGPHPGITPGVLDLLAENDIRCTFFVLGEHIVGNEDLLERMINEGHEIGNHLVEDRPSITLSDKEFIRQLEVVDPWIDPSAPHRWMRPGSGWFTPDMVELAAQHGYGLCLGSIFPHDDKIHDPQTLADKVLGSMYPGAIIILHDGQDQRAGLVKTLQLVLEGLKAEGYEVLTVSELVARGTPPQKTTSG